MPHPLTPPTDPYYASVMETNRPPVSRRVRAFRTLRTRDYFACIARRVVYDVDEDTGHLVPTGEERRRWCLKFWSRRLKMWMGTFTPASRSRLLVLPVVAR